MYFIDAISIVLRVCIYRFGLEHEREIDREKPPFNIETHYSTRFSADFQLLKTKVQLPHHLYNIQWGCECGFVPHASFARREPENAKHIVKCNL